MNIISTIKNLIKQITYSKLEIGMVGGDFSTQSDSSYPTPHYSYINMINGTLHLETGRKCHSYTRKFFSLSDKLKVKLIYLWGLMYKRSFLYNSTDITKSIWKSLLPTCLDLIWSMGALLPLPPNESLAPSYHLTITANTGKKF